MARTRTFLPALLATSALLVAGCGSDAEDAIAPRLSEAADQGATEADACEASGEITVAAAASLTEAFTEIGEQLEADCEGSEITFTFDSSGKLSEQILSGAPIDVFASADEANAEKVAELAVGTPETFARNRLAIVTKPGNPEGIETLADLADAGVVALCAEDAPCGTFAAEALQAAGVSIDESTVTRGENAKGTLTAVSEGDAVAGIVYVTDAAAAADRVATVEIPDDQNVTATYPVVVIEGPGDDDLADAFVARLQTEAAQDVLAAAGFLGPS
jgi:molybdate transport system substrate-binding protein